MGGQMPQPNMQQPMPQPGVMQGMPAMPQRPGQQMPGMPQQPGMMQGQPMNDNQRFIDAARKILPSVSDKNPYLKEQVGHLIYDYVQKIIGVDKAPKITGMLIELPVQQIQEYLQSLDALNVKVQEANNLLSGHN